MARPTRDDWLTITLLLAVILFAPAAWIHFGALVGLILLGLLALVAAAAWLTDRR